jgi:hypothetical protein
LVYRDLRSLGKKGGRRTVSENSAQMLAVKRFRITLERRIVRVPHPPGRMSHLIFHRAAVALDRVAPIVLGDELLLGAGARKDGFAGHGDSDRVPALS